jgi:hypothetical protein
VILDFRREADEELLLGSLTLENGTVRFPETSVNNYHYTLRDSPEARRFISLVQLN